MKCRDFLLSPTSFTLPGLHGSVCWVKKRLFISSSQLHGHKHFPQPAGLCRSCQTQSTHTAKIQVNTAQLNGIQREDVFKRYVTWHSWMSHVLCQETAEKLSVTAHKLNICVWLWTEMIINTFIAARLRRKKILERSSNAQFLMLKWRCTAMPRSVLVVIWQHHIC